MRIWYWLNQHSWFITHFHLQLWYFRSHPLPEHPVLCQPPPPHQLLESHPRPARRPEDPRGVPLWTERDAGAFYVCHPCGIISQDNDACFPPAPYASQQGTTDGADDASWVIAESGLPSYGHVTECCHVPGGSSHSVWLWYVLKILKIWVLIVKNMFCSFHVLPLA